MQCIVMIVLQKNNYFFYLTILSKGIMQKCQKYDFLKMNVGVILAILPYFLHNFQYFFFSLTNHRQAKFKSCLNFFGTTCIAKYKRWKWALSNKRWTNVINYLHLYTILFFFCVFSIYEFFVSLIFRFVKKIFAGIYSN